MSNPKYSFLLGAELDCLYVEDWRISLDLSKHSDDEMNHRSFELECVAHISLSLEEIGQQIEDDKICNSDVVKMLYDSLGSDVREFTTVPDKRALYLKIGNQDFYFWADQTPPRSIFYVKSFGQVDGEFKQLNEWEMDNA